MLFISFNFSLIGTSLVRLKVRNFMWQKKGFEIKPWNFLIWIKSGPLFSAF